MGCRKHEIAKEDCYRCWEAEKIMTLMEKPDPSAKLACSDGLCRTTIEHCASLLEKDGLRMHNSWDEYIASGGKGPATSFASIPMAYAEMLRKLKA